MKKIKKILPIGITMLSFPFVVGAAVTDIDDLFSLITDILGSLVPIVIGIAVVIFLIGVLKYVRSGEDEEERKKARGLMIFGIIALFVMVSVWGLVNILGGTLGLDTTAPTTDIDNLLPLTAPTTDIDNLLPL